jgi:amino acid permease
MSGMVLNRTSSIEEDAEEFRFEKQRLVEPQPEKTVRSRAHAPLPRVDSSPQGTVRSGVFNLLSTCIGGHPHGTGRPHSAGGTLTLPYAFASGGILVSLALVILSALTSAISMLYLVKSRRLCRDFGVDASTYDAVARHAFGKKAEFLMSLLLFFLTFLAVVAYLILLGDLLTPLAVVAGAPRPISDRTFVIGAAALLILPVALFRSLTAMRHTSALSALAVAFLLLVVTFRSASTPPAARPPVALANADMRLFFALSLIGLSFLCHFNLLPAVKELRTPSRDNVRRLVALSMAIPAAVYATVGIAGYLQFGDATRDDILNNYQCRDSLVIAGRIALSLTLLFHLPLLIHPCRAAVEALLRISKPTPSLPHAVATVAIAATTFITASYVPKVSLIWSFYGATISVLIVYILPPLFFLRLRPAPSHSRWFRDRDVVGSVIFILFGAFLFVVCTYEAVLHAMATPSGSQDPCAAA